MDIIYTGEELPKKITKSIMLCGPSPRPGQEGQVDVWREDAIKILEDKGFDGVILNPETRDGHFGKDFDYDNQIDWEDNCINVADCIVFWVPRDLSLDEDGNLKLPAFTTNVEFGAWFDSGKVLFGAPPHAPKVRYLQRYADDYNLGNYENLTNLLQAAMDKLGEGSERVDGERYVPLMVWNTPSFKSWYHAQTEAGNVLEKAKLLYTFRPGFKDFVFLWVLKVEVYITSEKRSKTNEFVLARTDTSSVVMWYPEGESIEEYQVILIKEFRSPATTSDGFIYENAGGSAHDPKNDSFDTAIEEVHEETGLMLDSKRLKFIQARQVCGTLSSHKNHLHSYQLNEEELKWLKSQDGIVHGVEEDTERSFVTIHSVKDILESADVDWANLGQILSIIVKN